MATMCMELPVIEITASTEDNFLAYNRQAEDLDSDWLMQPVNEAEYDSETQFCVDTKAGEAAEKASFYAHYVTKRKRTKNPKRGKKQAVQDDDPTKLSVGGHGGCHPHVVHRSIVTHAPTPTPAPTAAPAAPTSPAMLNVDLLTLPGMPAPPKGSLNSAAPRRIACGALPPGLRGPHKAPITAADMQAPKGSSAEGAPDSPGHVAAHVDPTTAQTTLGLASPPGNEVPPPPSYEQASQQLNVKKPTKTAFSRNYSTTPPRSTTPSSAVPSSPSSPAESPTEAAEGTS